MTVVGLGGRSGLSMVIVEVIWLGDDGVVVAVLRWVLGDSEL